MPVPSLEIRKLTHNTYYAYQWIVLGDDHSVAQTQFDKTAMATKRSLVGSLPRIHRSGRPLTGGKCLPKGLHTFVGTT